MPEPTVVILAAGEGTRMKSAVPKVLHPLCGRPLICWPVAAARAAGAARVIVVDNPKRRLEEHLPDGVEIAIQQEPKGTGDAVAAAAAQIDPTSTVVVINGDVALSRRRRSPSSSRLTKPPVPRARWPRWSSTSRVRTGG